MKRRSARTAIGATVAVAVVALVATLRVSRSGVPVQVARAELGPFEAWVTTNGVIEPRDDRVIRSPVTSFVTAVRVVDGQRVMRGDPMFSIDVASQRADLARAREDAVTAEHTLRVLESGPDVGERAQLALELKSADAELARLRDVRDATARLVQQQAATRDELAQAEVAVTRAQATRDALARKAHELSGSSAPTLDAARLALARARETVALLEGQVAAADLRAPIDGTVYGLAVRAGRHVETGAELAHVADLRAVQLRAFVDEPELAGIKVGEALEVSWSAMPGRTWTGQVERVPRSVVERGDRTVGDVICSVGNDDERLIPNLDVDVRIRVQSYPRALLLPRQAVRTDQQGRYVFVVHDSRIARRTIKVDAANTTTFAVGGGLRPGEMVAISGDSELRDGMAVRVEDSQQ